MEEREARLNVTYNGSNGDLPDPVAYDASDEAVRQMAKEAIENGNIPGITVDGEADLTDFVVVRFPADDGSGLGNRLFVHPKTPFGRG